MKPLGAIVSALITVTVFFTGCGPSFHEYNTLQDRKTQKQSIVQQNITSISDISLIAKWKYENELYIDSLIEKSQDFIDYLEFRRNYSNYKDQIMSKLRDKDYDSADGLVRNLASRLQRDDNPYAKLYLEKAKNFNYTARIHYTAIAGEKHESNENVGVYTGGILALPAIGFMSALGDDSAYNMTFGNWVVRKKVKKQFYDEIQVNPYKNEKRVIKKQVLVGEVK